MNLAGAPAEAERSLRIAMLVNEFPVISETFVVDQVTSLLCAGHTVDVFALNGESGTQIRYVTAHSSPQLMACVHLSERAPERLTERIPAWLRLACSCLVSRPLQTARQVNPLRHRRRAVTLRTLFEESVLLKRPPAPYDVVHAQFGYVGLKALRMRETGLLEGPLITHFRGSDVTQFVSSYGSRCYDRLFASGEHFLANCEHFRARAIELGCPSDRIAVLGTGIDLRRFPFSEPAAVQGDTTRLMSVGRLVEKKGLAYAIRAAAQLAAQGLDIRYDMVGDGPLKGQLQTLIDELNVSDRVRLLGKREPEEIATLLASSQLFVAPSVTAQRGDQDAPVNTLKEAMAIGRPVIATEHGGIPELVEHEVSGLLVPERDSEALAAAIRRLTAAPQRWKQLARAGRRAVEKSYDLRDITHRLLEIYWEVAARDRARHGRASIATATQTAT
ncbi:MAG: glycosyltransferase [Gammaproteobacteria bacterium]